MTPANHYQISAAITAILNFILFWIVSKKGSNTNLTNHFRVYSAAIIIWSFFVVLATTVDKPNLSLLFSQICHAGATMIAVFFYHFVCIYLGFSRKPTSLKIAYLVALTFLSIILFVPNLFFDGVSAKYGFHYFPDSGPFYLAWTLYFFIVVVISLSVLLRRSFLAEGNLRKQIRFFMWANLIGYSGGIGCFLPVYDLDLFPFPYGAYGVVLFSLVTAYTILRYKFLDIDVIIKKTLVFAGLFAMSMAIVALVTTITQNILGQYFEFNTNASVAICVAIVILLYEPTRMLLINATDKYLFQKKFDLTQMVAEGSKELSRIRTLKRLARRIVAFIVTKCRIQKAAVYVYDNKESYVNEAMAGYHQSDKPSQIISLENQLIKLLEEKGDALDMEVLQEELQSAKVAGDAKRLLDVSVSLLKELDAELVIPTFTAFSDVNSGAEHQTGFKPRNVKIKSILVLGGKKSDEPYSREEKNVFYSLAQESATAIENSYHFGEVLDRSEKLEVANKQILEQRDKLVEKEKKATMAGMAGAIGHEINNPLTAIYLGMERLGMTVLPKLYDIVDQLIVKVVDARQETANEDLNEMCSKRDDLKKKITDVQERVGFNCNRIRNYIENMKSLMNDMKSGMSTIQASKLCELGHSVCEENIPDCKVTFELDRNCKFFGNLESLVDVIKNLIMNAYEAMAEQADKTIHIVCGVNESEPDLIFVSVTDNGPGMSEEVRNSIWAQGYSTKDRTDNGIGAAGQGEGLYMCKTMVESFHGGDISVQSEVGQGSTFTMKFNKLDE